MEIFLLEVDFLKKSLGDVIGDNWRSLGDLFNA